MDQDAAGLPAAGTGRRYGDGPLEAAGARALELDVVSVGKIASMLERATEQARVPAAAATAPTARFARDPAEFTGHTGQLTLLPGTPGQASGCWRPPCANATSSVSWSRPSCARPCAHSSSARCSTPYPSGSPGPPAAAAHADFLQLVLADEVSRRDAKSAQLRARAAGLDPTMQLDTWDETAAVRYDRQLWNELVSLRFVDGPHGALLLGPVGVGKTHLTSTLGHIAIRRRRSVLTTGLTRSKV